MNKDYYPSVSKPVEKNEKILPSSRDEFGWIVLRNLRVGDFIANFGTVVYKDEKILRYVNHKGVEEVLKLSSTKMKQTVHEFGGLVSMSGLLSYKQIGDIVDIIKRDSDIIIEENGVVKLKDSYDMYSTENMSHDQFEREPE
jgi:hypothetical protein